MSRVYLKSVRYAVLTHGETHVNIVLQTEAYLNDVLSHIA